MNEFGLFQAIYCAHFLHAFHAQGVTLENRVLATSSWIFSHGILKIAEELIVPGHRTCIAGNFHRVFIFVLNSQQEITLKYFQSWQDWHQG